MVASSSAARFTDTQTHWARSFIEALAQRGIVNGFPDRTFRPDRPINRAEFATLLQAAFSRPTKRPYTPFVDFPANYWAAGSIRKAFEMGFLSGFPNQQFRPLDPLMRVQAIVALVNGLDLKPASDLSLTTLYQDINQVPSWATHLVAAATEAGIVVNYPSLQRLRSQDNTTRGEVAALIYQGLVALGQAPPIASEYIVQKPKTVAVSHGREFRGVWVSCIWGADFPSRPGLSAAQQQAEWIALLDQVQAMNFNAVVLQVRPEGDALYDSKLEPWSHWLTGKQGKPPEPYYDPLQFAIDQCHRRNIELHAWFNPYRASNTGDKFQVAPHIAVTNPEVVYDWGNQRWMDPGAKVVQDLTYNVILDVVRRYDVDGVQIDDYFYPYPIAGQEFPDSKTYQAYKTGGGTLSLGDWRRENVNQLVQRLATGVRAEKSWVKFGVSPFGIYRPGQPAQIRGLDAYDTLYADALKWLQQGWLDYFAPQLYWRIDPPAQSYPVLLNWWLDNNPKQRHVYVGNSLVKLGQDRDLTEIDRQVALTRQSVPRQALGNIFFSMEVFAENRLGIRDRFQSDTYRTPVLVPVMPWLGGTAPPPPSVQASNGQLTWSPGSPAASQRAWTVYQKQGDQWTLHRLLPTTTTTLKAGPGTYAVCAVSRSAIESLGTIATLKG